MKRKRREGARVKGEERTGMREDRGRERYERGREKRDERGEGEKP